MALWKAFSLRHLFKGLHSSGTVKYGSALFVSGDKATDVCVVVNPHIEWPDNIEEIQQNANRRGLDKSCVDMEQLKCVWDFYNKIKKAKEDVENNVLKYNEKIVDLKQNKETVPQEEIDKCKLQQNILREDLRTLKTSWWAAEEKAILRILSLPNKIHAFTPDEMPTTIYTYKDCPQFVNPRSHLDIGVEKDLLQLYSGQSYYLKNDAAVFELASKFYFSTGLRKAGCIQFSNADFVKSLVIEGCGGNHKDSDCVFILHHNENSKVKEDLRLHLVGGGSLCSFAAYHTRNLVPYKMLPLRYFTLGRQYKPVPEGSKLGLYQVAQSAVVEIFTMVGDSDEHLDNQILQTTELIRNLYEGIGFHFKICYLPSHQLATWECLRVSFQMFSPWLNEYVEVGNISVSDSYISKRLQILYKGRYGNQFVKILSGTVLNVPKLLANVLEYSNEEEFKIPQVLKDSLAE